MKDKRACKILRIFVSTLYRYWSLSQERQGAWRRLRVGLRSAQVRAYDDRA